MKLSVQQMVEPFSLNQGRHLEGSTDTTNASWSFIWTSVVSLCCPVRIQNVNKIYGCLKNILTGKGQRRKQQKYPGQGVWGITATVATGYMQVFEGNEAKLRVNFCPNANLLLLVSTLEISFHNLDMLEPVNKAISVSTFLFVILIKEIWECKDQLCKCNDMGLHLCN